MKNQDAENRWRNKIPWNLIVQIALAGVFFYFLGWLVNSLSFAGQNGINTQATEPVSALEIFDNFGFKVYDTKWNEATWAEVGTGSIIEQLDGVLSLSRQVKGWGGLVAQHRRWRLNQVNFVESKLMLNSGVQAQAGEIGFEINFTADRTQWFARCGIRGGRALQKASAFCTTADGFSTTPVDVSYDTWHILRFEIDAETATLSFFVDGQAVGTYTPQDQNTLKNSEYVLMLMGETSGDGTLAGSFDQIRLKNR